MSDIPAIGGGALEKVEDLKRLIASQRQPEFSDVDRLLCDADEFLGMCHARISVVGQVKAGKSTLINVVSGARDLLPTQVNPWTAVITNLHFGHPDKPQSGGVFELFSEGEWARMLEGDKETREMAERLLPGFDSSVLKAQVEEMQETARRRLGSLYKHLLGKRHQFNSITPEVLERYVSAGYQGADDDETVSAGRFSSITKSAEVFLGLGPFAVPVTLSDTPGINDPFLVRDEITTNSFRDTDIFVVALSIHQALGVADMALLKMLSRHPDKRTEIFVNRIDEVDDPAVDVPVVMQNLAEKLSIELAGAQYRVIAGSAHWGHVALFGSDDEVKAIVEGDAFFHYAEICGLDPALSARERVLAASGVPALGQALSADITEGPVQAAVDKITTEVSTTFGMLEKLLQSRLENEDITLMDVGDIPALLAEEKARLIDRVNVLTDLADELDTREDEVRRNLLKNGEVLANSVTLSLEATLESFVDMQTVKLAEAFAAENGKTSWSLDRETLCQRIEEQTIASYQTGRAEMDALILRFATKTTAQMEGVLSGLAIDNLLENLPHDSIFPGYKPPNTLCEIDLVNERGWRFWKNTEMTKEEAISRVQTVIRSEMRAGIMKCSDGARLAIAERTGEALARISKVKLTARTLLVDEVTELKAQIETLNEGVSAEAVSRINEHKATRAQALRTKIKQLKRVRAALGTENMQGVTSQSQEAGADLC